MRKWLTEFPEPTMERCRMVTLNIRNVNKTVFEEARVNQ